MSTGDADPTIYPAHRVLEHLVATPEVQPVRLFAVLWPLWDVETEIDATEHQHYGLVEEYIVRCVVEADFSAISDIAGFLGLESKQVQRYHRHLQNIGHAERGPEAGPIQLTDLGYRSAGDRVRYVRQVARHPVRIERLSSCPLPRHLYDGALPLVETTTWRRGAGWRPVFTAIDCGGDGFDPADVESLATRSDREELNLPRDIHALRVVEAHPRYLPLYLVETVEDGLLAYAPGEVGREPFFERIAMAEPSLVALIEDDDGASEQVRWTEWLDRGPEPGGDVRRLPSGTWRVTFPAEVFGPKQEGRRRLSLLRLGSFELREQHFMQLWCAEPELRRQALIARVANMAAAGMIRTVVDLDGRLGELATLLEVDSPTLQELLDVADRDHPAAADRLRRMDTVAVPR